MANEKDYTELFGTSAVNKLLEAVDHDAFGIEHALVFAKKLYPSVGGKLKKKVKSHSFEWNRNAMRDVLSHVYQLCCPETKEEEQTKRNMILDILTDPDIGLKNMAVEIAKC